MRYRTAGGRVHPAVITLVTSQTVVNLRVGNGPTKSTIVGALKVSAHTTGAGWFHSGG